MVAGKVTTSNSEGMRLIKAGAVYIDGERISPEGNLELDLTKPHIIKVGKLRYFLVEPSDEKHNKN